MAIERDSDDFSAPDEVGFATLRDAAFVRFGDMVFKKVAFDPQRIAKRMRLESPEVVQREINHTDLVLYASDPRVQRDWGRSLEARWRARLEREFPDLRTRVQTTDTGADVVVTFWSERKAKR